jgi:hypothetical protein
MIAAEAEHGQDDKTATGKIRAIDQNGDGKLSKDECDEGMKMMKKDASSFHLFSAEFIRPSATDA